MRSEASMQSVCGERWPLIGAPDIPVPLHPVRSAGTDVSQAVRADASSSVIWKIEKSRASPACAYVSTYVWDEARRGSTRNRTGSIESIRAVPPQLGHVDSSVGTTGLV